jgi:hypothetical protein
MEAKKAVVAVLIGEETICLDCLKPGEHINLMRGFLDTISLQEIKVREYFKEKEYLCNRCRKKIPTDPGKSVRIPGRTGPDPRFHESGQ